tara:strand:+ start:133 stop:1062 length:930 start_codon:yes stop_codon:yes gene_type:complete
MSKLNVLVLGGNGLVGSAVCRILDGSTKIDKLFKSTRNDTNLFSIEETKKLISDVKPDVLINAAAKVGGIYANDTQRTSFIIDNLKINMNILESCISNNKIKILNLGSSCIYPLNADNPINEKSIMSGALEPTNSPYAMAKLSSIEIGDAMTKEYGHKIINLMPTNLYGPNDNFSETTSHVIPGLISRMYKSKMNSEKNFQIWGTGNPLREFLYVDDLANAIEFLLDHDTKETLINIGSGNEISINDLAISIKKIIGYQGEISHDETKPDGNPRKLLDSSLINNLGWKSYTKLNDGLTKTFEWYKKNII